MKRSINLKRKLYKYKKLNTNFKKFNLTAFILVMIIKFKSSKKLLIKKLFFLTKMGKLNKNPPDVLKK